MSDQTAGADSEPAQEPVPEQQVQANVSNQESVTGILSRELTKEYVKFVTGIYAIVAAGIGLGIILVGILGINPLSPELSSVVQGPLDSNVENLDAILAQMQTNRIATQALNIAPVGAAVIGVLVGLYVGSNLHGSDRESYVTAGASSAVGAAVFTAIVGFIASWQVQPIPRPELAGQAAQEFEQDPLVQDIGLSVVEGIPSAILVGGTDVSVQGLLLFAILVGVGAGVAAAGGVYVIRNLAPDASEPVSRV